MRILSLTLIIVLIASIKTVTGQKNCDNHKKVPKEFYRSGYYEFNMNAGFPYTMFNKTRDNWNLDSTLSNIRNRILSTKLKPDPLLRYFAVDDYAKAYKEIFVSQNGINEPSTCSKDKACDHPMWVKRNAFLALIGIKYEWLQGYKDTFYLMPDALKEEFKDKATAGLRNLNPNVIGCGGGKDCGIIHEKAFDLMQYLQAYDMLKTAGYLTNDRNGENCTARNKLRKFSRNLYAESNFVINSRIGWKKNHGIICASVLGMAAIVLHDAGSRDLRFKYNPKNWHVRAVGDGGSNIFNVGEDGLEDLFFIGKHNGNLVGVQNVPQTNSDGTSGFAEGPGYFNYSLRALLPFMRTRENFVPYEKSFLNDSRYKNMLNWYQDISNSDGRAPSYDNSKLNNLNFLGILGNESFSSAIPPTSGFFGNVDLTIDYILALGENKERKSEDYVNDYSGWLRRYPENNMLLIFCNL